MLRHDDHPTIRFREAVRASAVAVAVLTLSACASSSGAPATSPTTPTSEARPSSSGSPADATTTREVTHAYKVVFGSDYPPAQSVAALQHGADFAATIAKEAKSSRAQNASVTVSAVRLLNPDVAAVTFAISVNGTAMLPGAQGDAVREDGRWKVAASTFCGLLQLEGPTPAACVQASATSLPS